MHTVAFGPAAPYAGVACELFETGVLRVTMRRPASYNAWRPQEFLDLIDVYERAASDERVVVVVLTGEGKFFSSGADVKVGLEPGAMRDPEHSRTHLTRTTKRITQVLIDFPKVAIAALNGPVVGLPAALLPLFDAVYAAETATLSLPFTTLAINSEGAASFALPLTVGLSNAGDMLLLARVQTSRDLLQKGLVSQVFPDETFAASVLDIAHAAAKLPRGSLLANKRLLRDPIRAQLHRAIDAEVDSLVQRFQTGEPQRVFAAFAARSPAFTKPKL